jgi:membrane-associated protein
MHAVHMSALQGQLEGMLTQIGPILFYLVVWGLVFIGTALLVGLVIPFLTGDTLLFASGIVAASGLGINIWVLAIGTGLAAFAGDQVGYAIGRRLGRPYLDKRGGRRTQAMIARTDRFFNLYGWGSVVIGRFIPWGRVFIPIIAGAAKMRFLRFASANLLGTLAWGVGITVIGYFAASSPQVKVVSYVIAIVCIVASLVVGFRAWYLDRRPRNSPLQVAGNSDNQEHARQQDIHGQSDVPLDGAA